MKKIGEKAKMESSMVCVPAKVEDMRANILTIDLRKHFQGKEDMIPDPHWLALKAAVNHSKCRGLPLLCACGAWWQSSDRRNRGSLFLAK